MYMDMMHHQLSTEAGKELSQVTAEKAPCSASTAKSQKPKHCLFCVQHQQSLGCASASMM